MEILRDIILFFADPWPQAGLVFGLAIALTVFADTVGRGLLARIARRTTTDLDDQVLDITRRPISMTILLIGVWGALVVGKSPEHIRALGWSICVSVAVFFWTVAGLRVSSLLLNAAARLNRTVIHDETRPVFEMAVKVLIVGVAAYFFFHAWGINLSAWVAGAGVTGLVLGLAAQDTLSNLFAGLFILTDAPFKLGDFLTLQDGTRGRVVNIGLRSTRILTNHHVEIIIPNSQLASGRITNESGGTVSAARIAVPVGVAYGVDVEEVRGYLLEEALQVEGLAEGPDHAPRVRFMSFGASSLDFEVLVWPREPAVCEDIIDDLNTRIYKRLTRENIEIPYNKLDVHHFRGDRGVFTEGGDD